MNAMTELLPLKHPVGSRRNKFLRHHPERLDSCGQVQRIGTELGKQRDDKNDTETSACKN